MELLTTVPLLITDDLGMRKLPLRGISQQAIANLIRRGRLTSITVAGRTLVLRSEVESFVPQPKLGRPPKKTAAKKSPKKAPNK